MAVSQFLNAVYFSLPDAPKPYTFGTVWTLEDIDTSKVLHELVSDWSQGISPKGDQRSLQEAGLRPGMRLRVRFL
jgi:hypothetical protein